MCARPSGPCCVACLAFSCFRRAQEAHERERVMVLYRGGRARGLEGWRVGFGPDARLACAPCTHSFEPSTGHHCSAEALKRWAWTCMGPCIILKRLSRRAYALPTGARGGMTPFDASGASSCATTPACTCCTHAGTHIFKRCSLNTVSPLKRHSNLQSSHAYRVHEAPAHRHRWLFRRELQGRGGTSIGPSNVPTTERTSRGL